MEVDCDGQLGVVPIMTFICLIPAANYMFEVNNRNTRTWCQICPKLTIKTPERRHWPCFSVSIVNFEQVNADWHITTSENGCFTVQKVRSTPQAITPKNEVNEYFTTSDVLQKMMFLKVSQYSRESTCWSLYLIKLQVRSATLLKRDFNAGVFL